jgi:hypothetical protein
MAIEVGHYYAPGSLFVFPTVVQAFWEFDEHDKLREIRIQRFSRGL